MQITNLSIERLNENSWLCTPLNSSLKVTEWVRGLTTDSPDWLRDCVMVANSVMLVTQDEFDPWQIRRSIAQTFLLIGSHTQPIRHHHLTIDTACALDLEEVLKHVAMDAKALYGALSNIEFVVSANGFAPGFSYLSGLPKSLHLPRKATPRTAVPAGSFAIASEYAAIYPKVSPGGWYLLGHCEQTLFDVMQHPPSFLQLGDTVHFDFVGCHA
jgi:KipI family sensor histidine kinase inhibitor